MFQMQLVQPPHQGEVLLALRHHSEHRIIPSDRQGSGKLLRFSALFELSISE
jgi:hypothetical protein